MCVAVACAIKLNTAYGVRVHKVHYLNFNLEVLPIAERTCVETRWPGCVNCRRISLC